MNTVLRAENIKKRYACEEVLRGIDVTFSEPSFSVVLGQSGCGKSTLLNILSGLVKPTEGRVLLDDREITQMPDRELAEIKRRQFGYVFQNYLLLNNLNVEENIRIGAPDPSEVISLGRLAETLDIKDVLSKFPATLSGGQQQRAAIARAVIKKPRFLFCDEATGALDEENSKRVVALLHSVKDAFGITVIFVTHNLSIAKTADRVLTMKNGIIVGDEPNQTPIRAEQMDW